MTNETLLLAGTVALGVGAAYLYVGFRIGSRTPTTPEAKRALGFFSLWWYALAANLFLGGLLYVGSALGGPSFPLQLTYAHVQRALLAVSLVGLMYYLLYLLTGRGFLPGLVAFYAVYYLLIVYILVSGEPAGVYVGGWRTDVLASRPTPPALALANAGMLILPPVVGAGAYFRLVFVVPDRSARYRAALISASIILWWVVAVVAGQREAQGVEWFQMVNRFLGLLAACAILMAYHPPTWVRERWGIRAFA